jgi:hypothetical protein
MKKAGIAELKNNLSQWLGSKIDEQRSGRDRLGALTRIELMSAMERRRLKIPIWPAVSPPHAPK